MKRICASAAVLIAMAAITMPARAQGVDQDVRCLVASNIFMKAEKDPTRRELAVASFYFYLGRINGKIAPAALKTQLLAQAKALTPATAGAEMTNCAKTTLSQQASLQAIGRELMPQAATPAPAPKKR